MSNFEQLKIAAIQMRSCSNLEENLLSAALHISNAKEVGAQMVVLPEYFAIMAQKEEDKLPFVEMHQDGKVQEFLSKQAKKHQLWIIGGSHPIKSDDPQRPYARCYVYNSDGKCTSWYDKIHLFDVEIKNASSNVNVNAKNSSYNESRFSSAGKQVVSFDSPWGKIGLAVCYDLRFPELFRKLMQQKTKLLIVPAAFTYTTGKAHWELLLKARAVENLCFVAASGQGGLHENGRETWGHSCIIDPWGKILDSLELEPGFAISALDFAGQSKLREEFPVLNHQIL